MVCSYLVEYARSFGDLGEHVKEIDRALATMGRYGRQSMVDLERISLRKLHQWVAALAHLIDREHEAAKSRR